MKTNNKVKIASKIGALALAAAAYMFLGSNQSGVEVNTPINQLQSVAEDDYLVVDEENDFEGQTFSAEEIREVCPEGETLCATPTDPESELPDIMWEGSTTKF